MKIDVSKLGYRWKGRINTSSSYKKGDVVRVGDQAHVFTSDSTSNHDVSKSTFAVGQLQMDTKGQVAIDNPVFPAGREGMELRSKADTIGGTATFSAEFRHSQDRQGTKAVALPKVQRHKRYGPQGVYAIMTDGTVRYAGPNYYGVNGTMDSSTNFPMYTGGHVLPLPKGVVAKKMWSMYLSNFVLDQNNELWSAGYYWQGGTQANYGQATVQPVWQRIASTSDIGDDEIVEMTGGYCVNCYAAGTVSYFALGRSGKVYSWGDNTQYILGHGDNTARYNPTLIEFTQDHPMKYVHHLAGPSPSCTMIDIEGKMWTSGNTPQNFGPANKTQFSKYDPWGSENAKVKEAGALHNQTNSSYTGNYYYMYVVLEDGRLFLSGNQSGVYVYWNGSIRANGWRLESYINPNLPILEGVSTYAGFPGSYTNFAAVMQDGRVRTAGHSPMCSGGANDVVNFNYLVDYNGNDITNVVDIQHIGGRYGNAYGFRTSDGEIYSIGYNGSDYLRGDGTSNTGATQAVMYPARVPGKVVDFYYGGYKTVDGGSEQTFGVALAENGNVYAWGYNGAYNIADGTGTTNIAGPVQIKF